MIVVTRCIIPGMFLARYGDGPYRLRACPIAAAWAACVAAMKWGGGA